MDKVQAEMLKHTPRKKSKEKVISKGMLIGAGIAIGCAAAYFLGPKIIGHIQARQIAKVAKVI